MVKIILRCLGMLATSSAMAAQLSIIIDDVGNSARDFALLDLHPNITLSVLPSSPYAKDIAEQAQQQQREIMLHLPMQGSGTIALGPYGLPDNLEEAAFKQRVEAAINDFPEATGLNNHMGSQLTQLPTEMHWLMQVLAKQQLFFVDSRTHLASIAQQTARVYQVPNLKRHVFLDHQDNPVAIERQWQKALSLARKYGHAVLIAHPRPHSVDLLNQLSLPEDVQLVGVAQRLALLAPELESEPSIRLVGSEEPIVQPVHNKQL
ncbi:divergent polysaccharide deacetylase family protein [Agarivorans sp. OAG1]|uniref:divergent polysaccharide deacetylase family protein n=1 Tax=Agarivorans sp. OAG1 TaxID=3082387 RepID=UPI0030D056D5